MKITGLRKHLGFFALFSLAAGAMISSGLFVLPAIAFREAGAACLVSYLLAGVLMLPSVFTKAELITAMTRSGGTYFYAKRILGTPAGLIAGFADWFSVALKSSFALIGIGAFAVLAFPSLGPDGMKLTAVACCLVFTVINLLSVKHSGGLQSLLVVALLGILALFVLIGWRYVHFPRFTGVLHVLDPVGSGKEDLLRKVLEATGLVFISYGGLTKIVSVAGESREAGRQIPRAMLWAFAVVTCMYLLVVAVTIGVLEPSTLMGSLTPISTAADAFAGGVGRITLAVAAVLAFVTTANAGILAASRVPMAMSGDSLLPGMFARVGRRTGTPWVSILFTSAFMLAVVVLLDLEMLAKVASTFMILLFILDNLSLLVVRYSRVRYYRPSYRSPLFPWLQFAAIIAYSILIAQMGRLPLAIAFGFILFAFLWYSLYASRHDRRNSALIKLAARVLNRRLLDDRFDALEDELLEILQERDDIHEDRFDHLLRGAPVIDLDGAHTRAEFFSALSRELAPGLSLSTEQVYDLFCERERMSNTNISAGLAIPHLLLEGQNRFMVALARSRQGIAWSEGQPPVHAVFALLGTMDQRDFHLRALMAIAQIVQQPAFLQRWLAAKDAEDLRALLLLSQRRREQPVEAI